MRWCALFILLFGTSVLQAQTPHPEQRKRWLYLEKLASDIREDSLCGLRPEISVDEANRFSRHRTETIEEFVSDAESYIARYASRAHGETLEKFRYQVWRAPFDAAATITSVSPDRCAALLHDAR